MGIQGRLEDRSQSHPCYKRDCVKLEGDKNTECRDSEQGRYVGGAHQWHVVGCSEIDGLGLGTQLAKASGITYDKKSERVSFAFSQEITPGDVVLSIDFTGTMNNAMAGFYRSKYKPTGEASGDTPKEDDFYYMLSTQFEACDARRAFPCFDEPNLKSTFDFEIEIPNGQTALSNMPVLSERDGSKPGLKFVTFEKTPVMSTYVSITEIP
jgi:aminopeptidase N